MTRKTAVARPKTKATQLPNFGHDYFHLCDNTELTHDPLWVTSTLTFREVEGFHSNNALMTAGLIVKNPDMFENRRIYKQDHVLT
jgi:hypothetical protein